MWTFILTVVGFHSPVHGPHCSSGFYFWSLRYCSGYVDRSAHRRKIPTYVSKLKAHNSLQLQYQPKLSPLHEIKFWLGLSKWQCNFVLNIDIDEIGERKEGMTEIRGSDEREVVEMDMKTKINFKLSIKTFGLVIRLFTTVKEVLILNSSYSTNKIKKRKEKKNNLKSFSSFFLMTVGYCPCHEYKTIVGRELLA